jgi:hypothetical protein
MKKKRARSGFICTLVLVFYLAFALWLGGLAGGPAGLVRALQAASQPNTAAQPTISPVYVMQTVFGAMQAGDVATVAALTGGSGTTPGLSNWGSIDLIAFPGHIVFGPLNYQVVGQSATGANVRVTGTFVFTDPGGPQGVGSRDAFAIDGEAVLVAKGNSWVITGLPNYDWIIPCKPCRGPGTPGGRAGESSVALNFLGAPPPSATAATAATTETTTPAAGIPR